MVMRLVSNPEAAAAFALASDGLSPAYALLSNSIVTGRAARRITPGRGFAPRRFLAVCDYGANERVQVFDPDTGAFFVSPA